VGGVLSRRGGLSPGCQPVGLLYCLKISLHTMWNSVRMEGHAAQITPQVPWWITPHLLYTSCRHGPTPEALKEYEAVRAPRVHEIHNVSTWMAKRVGVQVQLFKQASS
jgi:hypothetical protein